MDRKRASKRSERTERMPEKNSKIVQDLFFEYLDKAKTPENGEDAAGWANALMQLVKTYGYWLAFEQQAAVNFTSGGFDAKRTPDTQN